MLAWVCLYDHTKPELLREKHFKLKTSDKNWTSFTPKYIHKWHNSLFREFKIFKWCYTLINIIADMKNQRDPKTTSSSHKFYNMHTHTHSLSLSSIKYWKYAVNCLNMRAHTHTSFTNAHRTHINFRRWIRIFFSFKILPGKIWIFHWVETVGHLLIEHD